MFLILLSFCLSEDPPSPRYPIPNAEQIRYQRAGLSAFVHFNMNTFTGLEVGDGSEDPNDFNLTSLDTDQWASVLKQAGFDRLIFTAKHHDGFCLWKTDTTNHSIKCSTNFQETSESGDILADLSKSCKKYGIGLGIYLSPWDQNSSYYGTDKYNDFYKSQLREILTNYGEIKEIWMDNWVGGDKRQNFDFDGYFSLVKELQPDCLIFSPYNSTIRWIGNEKGEAGDPCWYSINATYVNEYWNKNKKVDNEYIKHGDVNGDVYSPPEVDFTIQKKGWFWSEDKEKEIRSIDEIAQIYFNSVGRGQIFLINVSPNNEGRFPQSYVDRVLEFGWTLNCSFGRNYANQSMAAAALAVRGRDPQFDPRNMLYSYDPQMYWTMNDGMYTGYAWFDFTKKIIFDVVTISEHLELGQRVSKFTLMYEQDGFWKTFATGTTIGVKRMFRTKPIHAQKLYIKIEDSEDVPCIESFGLFKMQNGFELGQYIPINISVFQIYNVEFNGKWTYDEENNITSEKGATATAKFIGSYCTIVGPLGPDFGDMKIYLDDKLVGEVDAYFPYKRDRRELFRIEYVESGEHTVKVECASKSMGIHGIYYIDNYEIGLFEISSREYAVNKGDEAEIEIKRIAGSKTKVSVTVKTDYFTAKAGKHFTAFNQPITFEEGETSKIVKIQTIKYPENENLTFNVVIDEATLGSEIGFNYSSMVTIYSDEIPTTSDDGNLFIYAGGIIAGIMAIVIVILIIVLCKKRNSYDSLLTQSSVNNYVA